MVAIGVCTMPGQVRKVHGMAGQRDGASEKWESESLCEDVQPSKSVYRGQVVLLCNSTHRSDFQ